jgi:hypothetical protein
MVGWRQQRPESRHRNRFVFRFTVKKVERAATDKFKDCISLVPTEQ